MASNDRAIPAVRAVVNGAGQAVSAVPASVPIALTASGFIYAIAKVFHEHHHGPLDHAQAIAEAVGALEMIETTECPFGHPDFDWSEDAAHDVAMEAMQDWEKVDV